MPSVNEADDAWQISRDKTDRFQRATAEFTTDAFDGCGLCGPLPARPAPQASYPVLVHRLASLLHASFGPHLTMTPLRFAITSPHLDVKRTFTSELPIMHGVQSGFLAGMTTRTASAGAPGSHGVRDHGLLESALFRPQTGYYADLIEEVVALWESLAQNHPFIEGNKRTAFAGAYTLLAINGRDPMADADEVYAFVAALYEAHQFTFDRLVPWLRDHVAPQSKT